MDVALSSGGDFDKFWQLFDERLELCHKALMCRHNRLKGTLSDAAPIFLSIGMHCLGCPSSRGETVEEACAVHGIDVDKLLELVNEEANKPIAE